MVWFGKHNMEKVQRGCSDCTGPIISLSLSLSGTTVVILNGPVLAEDRDIGENAVVRYRLLGPRVDLFSVDPLTGRSDS